MGRDGGPRGGDGRRAGVRPRGDVPPRMGDSTRGGRPSRDEHPLNGGFVGYMRTASRESLRRSADLGPGNPAYWLGYEEGQADARRGRSGGPPRGGLHTMARGCAVLAVLVALVLATIFCLAYCSAWLG